MEIEPLWSFVSEHWGKITAVVAAAWAGVQTLHKTRKSKRAKLDDKKRRDAAIEDHLRGLPPDCVRALSEFARNRAHTVALDALDDGVQILVRQGVIVEGQRSSSGYAHRYYTLQAQYRPFVIEP